MGGLSPTIKIQTMNQFVILSFGVDSLNWPSFIEIGEIACRRFWMPSSYTTGRGWPWMDLHTRNGSASRLVADCNASIASPEIVANSMSGPALQGLRRWATSSHHCLWPALLILASLAASCLAAVLLLYLRQRIAVRLQLSGLVYPDPLVLAEGSSGEKEPEGKYHWSLHHKRLSCTYKIIKYGNFDL